MKIQLKLEEAAMFIMALLFYKQTGMSWGWFWALFLAPDLGMLGYLAGPKAGSISYNIFHNKGLALAFVLAGLSIDIPFILFAGIILFAHSSFDRMLGYGLKFPDSFHHTHLGSIASKKPLTEL